MQIDFHLAVPYANDQCLQQRRATRTGRGALRGDRARTIWTGQADTLPGTEKALYADTRWAITVEHLRRMFGSTDPRQIVDSTVQAESGIRRSWEAAG